ncbi:MAG: hypothetical protein A3K09_04470 [Nitrospinae bacterium RIFCSPLOWO2_12_FULL_47_7]|nr:MAG: hypothetical protein A3K09_04470 [Nitrospinae bacterium RIFCSPLOWO2_12_FULL_47_7]
MTTLKTAVLIFSFYLASQIPSKTLIGVVISITDGDTFSISVDGTEYRVRVAEVDSPDVKQPFHRQAMEFTSDLIFGKKVHVNYEMVNWSNKEIVGDVILPDGRNLSNELVAGGWAWHYRVKPVLNDTLARLEYSAWSHKVGLWVDPKPVPPWEYRKERIIPDPPELLNDVNYDQILSYGLVGDRKAKVYEWPACKSGKRIEPDDRVIFSSKREAELLGYKIAKSCPKS